MLKAALTIPSNILLHISLLCTGYIYLATSDSVWLGVFLSQIPGVCYLNLHNIIKWVDDLARHKFFLTLSGTGFVFAALNYIPLSDNISTWYYLIAPAMYCSFYYLLNFWLPILTSENSSSMLVKGNVLPEFVLSEHKGCEVSSHDLKGVPNILIFFRGNWCPFCIAQIQTVVDAYTEIENRGIRVVLISPQSAEKNTELANRFNVNFLFLRDQNLEYANQLKIKHHNGVPIGIFGYGRDTVLPVLVFTDHNFRMQHIIQTDNFKVRPTPDYFLKEIDRIQIRSFLEDKVNERTKELEIEQNKIDSLLRNILPCHAITELKETGFTTPRKYENVAILFADIVAFSEWARHLSAKEVVDKLHLIYSKFDQITCKYGLEKIKTIGDAYMCVGGIPSWSKCSPDNLLSAATEMQCFLRSTGITMRMGIHTGPVVTGVVGENKYAYDIYGDSVNIAARLETASLPGRVNISQEFKDILSNDYIFENRGDINIKNMGTIPMYFVEEKCDQMTTS